MPVIKSGKKCPVKELKSSVFCIAARGFLNPDEKKKNTSTN